MQDNAKNTAPAAVIKKLDIKTPEIKEMLAAGVQFGHQTQKWNPKMKDFIYTSKNKIHILDLTKTEEKLKEAMEFLYQAAHRGNILFVGTKRQASEIVKKAAVDSGSYFITHRWPGGLLTNYKLIQKSIKRLNQLETDFDKGVANRTKFEVSQQKKEWEKMNRIYEGIKTMEKFPIVLVIVDTKYERLAVREAKTLNIPIVAMVDTNCDPTAVAYPIPANDDAIRSISIVMQKLADSIKAGNEGHGVKHTFKDYSALEIQTIKKEEPEAKEVEEFAVIREDKMIMRDDSSVKQSKSSKQKGILESIQENKSTEKKTVKATKKTEAKKAEVKKEVAAKTAEKKVVKKVEKKPVKKAVKKVVKKTTAKK